MPEVRSVGIYWLALSGFLLGGRPTVYLYNHLQEEAVIMREFYVVGDDILF